MVPARMIPMATPAARLRGMTGSPPESVLAVAGPVERRLAEVLDAETARWAALTPDLTWPLDALRRLVLAGGKRLRPAFCYWAFIGACLLYTSRCV